MANYVTVIVLAALAMAAGCRKSEPARSPAPHPRIVSFSPALTGMLFEMGLGDHIVGVTSQCSLPPGENRPRVGDIFSIRAEPILAVQPDVVLAQSAAECFTTIRQIDPHVRIEHFQIERLKDIPVAARRLAVIARRPELGEARARQFESELSQLQQRVAGLSRPRVLFVMGYKQPSTGGRNTFIDDMITQAGGTNAASQYVGWQNVNLDGVMAMRPEVIVCWIDANVDQPQSARDYWLRLKGLPAADSGRVHIISDRDWTIPMLRLPNYIQQLINLLHPQAATRNMQP